MDLRSSLGGPTILDINTGFIRDTAGLDNLFMQKNAIFTEDDFSHYGYIIKTLREHVMKTFELSEMYFTAPTFITRIDAETDSTWTAKGKHISLKNVVT